MLSDLVVERLAELGFDDVEEVRTTTEKISFSLPKNLRADLMAAWTRTAAGADDLDDLLTDERLNVVLAGPGLGTGPQTRDLVAAWATAWDEVAPDLTAALLALKDTMAQTTAAIHAFLQTSPSTPTTESSRSPAASSSSPT